MAVNKYDTIKFTNVINIPAGCTYRDSVVYYQEDGVTPRNLAGCTATAQIRDLDDVLVATFACSIDDPLTGTIHRTLTESLTTLLPATLKRNTAGVLIPVLVHGTALKLMNNDVLPEVQGGVTVGPEIVKPV